MKPRRVRAGHLAIVALVFGLLAQPHSAFTETIRTAVPFPTRGETTEVIVETSAGLPASGAQVTAAYRPGSKVESSHTLGVTDSLGRVPWTPTEPGIASLTATWSDSAGDHSLTGNVSIRFHSVRPEGVVVAIVAGLILYGTVAYGFGRLRS